MVETVYGCEYRVLYVYVFIGDTCLLYLVQNSKQIGLYTARNRDLLAGLFWKSIARAD